ncbi:hypothetical protein V1389_10475 [Flavobacterium rakeshii]|uniref:hypothetical protein n=1 Tax=Flavobacterium rakeshii TaxID=1038845 RepID=UPI002E7B59C6|nr:hypothetical protein [Flavobacterium rakeshii]MEE1898763.1 hypothetical protein [Flavobacterium rakeshii]
MGVLSLCFCNDYVSQNKKNDELNLQVNKVLNVNDFFNCTKAKNTVFSNGNYVKFIAINNESYGIEVNINKTIDTLGFYLGCNTLTGMIPKPLFNSSDFICLTQGNGFSYRVLILCKLNNLKGIDVVKFETERDVSANTDGFIFKNNNNLYFFDLVKNKLYLKELPVNYSKLNIEKVTLHTNEVITLFDNGEKLVFKLKEFSNCNFESIDGANLSIKNYD